MYSWNMIEIGEIIEKRIKELKLTKAAVARKLGMDQSHFNQYTKNKKKPQLDGLVELCKAIQLTPSQILGFDNIFPLKQDLVEQIVGELEKKEGWRDLSSKLKAQMICTAYEHYCDNKKTELQQAEIISLVYSSIRNSQPQEPK